MAVHRFTVAYSEIIPSGSLCSNPTITTANPTCLTIPCSDSSSLDIEINTEDDCGQHCITFILDCSSACSSCGTVEVTKCFCVDSDDCGGCENCTGNVCVSTCAEGKVCDNDTCVDCTTDDECLCNSICVQGSCKCEGGLKKRADGCCVECFDGEDLGNCLICINGTIVAVDCPNGHCNPNTGECQECYNNTHCTGTNECCNAQGTCDCCPGYILDPVSGQCIEQPPCVNAQYCIDYFSPCYYCTEDGCAPIVCPAGFICDSTTGDCVPECGNCPEGYGCINGMCKPCSELSCTGVGLQCQFAEGCHCVGTACEWIDCDLDNVELAWTVTTGTQGQVDPNNPGLPNLAGTTSISPLGLVHEQSPNGSTYMNHQFNLGITNGTSGTWTLYNSPNSSISLGSGTSVSFDLQSTGPNLVGFVVKFVETGTGRTATWGIYRTPTAPLTAPDVWNYEFTSTGKSAGTIGGTPGGVKLCSNNLNFIPTGVTNVVTTGTLNISFISDGKGCLNAYITGCGTWNGDVTALCGGTTVTIPAPELVIDQSSCCDITDPNCDGWGTGEPCGDLTVQNITLVALPTYGSTGSGDGEFLIVADWTTAGLSFLDLFYLDPSDGCWSTASNPAASTNDIQIVTSAGQSPLGPSVSNLSVVATLGDGGCVRLGYTCELKIGGCKKLQGEVCLTECQAFTVDILDLGSNTYKAMPSIQDEAVTYTWSYPGLLNNTGQTVTITPVGGTTTLIVTAKYGATAKCTASDSLVLNTTVAGCTNSAACNYNSGASVDDNSCVLVGNPSYDCALGGFQPGLISALAESTPAVLWKIGGVIYSTNDPIDPGTYTVDVFFNGVQKCSKTLVVPQCYRCNASSICVSAPDGDNNGLYTTIDCDGQCSCSIEINITQVCNNNRSALVITATGDTGSYTVRANDVATGAQVLAPTSFTSAGSVTTQLLCDGIYRVIVEGANCDKSRDYSATCFDCAESTADLSSVSYDCPTNQLFFTIASDPCADSYTVQLLTSALVVKATQSYTSVGAKTIPVGVYPGDGSYIVRLTTNDGCVSNTELVLNCNGTLSPCPITSSSLTYTDDFTNISFTSTFVLSEAGGSYTVGLYSTTGGGATNCINAVPNALISQQTVTGALGSNVVNFPDAVGTPGTGTCYAVVVQRLGTGYGDCNDTAVVLVVPNSAPPVCSIDVTNLAYDTATGNILVSWNGENTSNDLTVEIRVSATPCNAADPIVVNIDGNGEDGLNIPFGPVHQSSAAQCATVTIYDTNEPTCSDSMTLEIAACTCAIVIDDSETFVDSVAETIEVTYTTRCTSGDITVDVSGDATGSAADAAASTNGTEVTNTKIISLTGYPSIGGTVVVEITDDLDVSCIDTQTVVLPQNCTSCAQVAALYLNDGTLTQISNHAGAVVITGSYDLVTDEAAIEADTETEVTIDGGNFCPDATPVDVANSRNAGIAVNQDDTDYQSLDHVLVEHTDWVGTRKFYFTDCGCGIARRCDYTANLSISATATAIQLYYAINDASQDYTGTVSVAITTPQTFNASALANIEAQFLAALTGTSCNSDVAAVTASYDSGTDVLTIVVTGTNAGLGVLHTYESSSVGDVSEFTQSNCV